jgi:dTDP-4-dehydrorhamnose reductase
MTCEGIASWADFAREIFKDAGIDKKVEDCSTSEYARPAPRPRNTSLEQKNITQFGLPRMPNWKDALAQFVISEFR